MVDSTACCVGSSMGKVTDGRLKFFSNSSRHDSLLNNGVSVSTELCSLREGALV